MVTARGTGTPMGAEFQVNTVVADDQRLATVAIDPAGRFAVTWTSSNQDGTPSSVYARVYDANGVALGAEFRVNTSAAGAWSGWMRSRTT